MSRLMSCFLFSIRKQININNLALASVTDKTPNLLWNPTSRVLTVATAEARKWKQEIAEEAGRREGWTPGPNPGTGH